MSNLIIAGDPGANEKRIRMMWSKSNGHSFDRIWWGPYDAVAALLSGFLNGKSGVLINAESWDFIQPDGGPIGILTVRYAGSALNGGHPGEGDAVETVSISFTDETFPIHQNPSFVDLTSATVLSLESLLSDHTENPYSDDTTAEWQYYDTRSLGIDNYRVKLPQVTWSRIVPPNWPSELDLANVGAIFSTGDLAGSIGAPSLFDIPTGNVGIVADSLGKFTAGWLKGGTLDWLADGKAQLILTAEYGLWHNRLYNFIS